MQVVYVDFNKQEIQKVEDFDYGKNNSDCDNFNGYNSITITLNGDFSNRKIPYRILRILGKFLKKKL